MFDLQDLENSVNIIFFFRIPLIFFFLQKVLYRIEKTKPYGVSNKCFSIEITYGKPVTFIYNFESWCKLYNENN